MSTPTVGRTGPLPRTAWRDRVRVLTDASGVSLEGLGELVEAELTRLDGVLFTATPAEDLDEISRWARLSDAAWCGQVRAIVAAHNRMPAAQREFLACEVALALNLSDGAAQDLVATALLTASAPGLLEAVEAGMLTVRHAYAVLGALSGTGLSAEEQHAVVTLALARYTDQTPAQLAALVAKLVLLVNAAASEAREQDRTAQRHVRFRAVEDGQGLLVARGPLAQIEAVRAALTTQLGPADPDQPSTQDAREFDLLVQLLTTSTGGEAGGQWTAAIVIPHNLATSTDNPDTEAWADGELAEIPGLGPVLPETARDILATCTTVTRIVVDDNGQVLDVSAPLPGPAAAATDNDPMRWLHQLTALPLTGTPAGSSTYRPPSGYAATSRPATAPAPSPAAPAPPPAPTSTTGCPTPSAPPTPRTCTASVVGTTAPNKRSSRSGVSPTAPSDGSPAAAGTSTDHPRATDRPQHPRQQPAPPTPPPHLRHPEPQAIPGLRPARTRWCLNSPLNPGQHSSSLGTGDADGAVGRGSQTSSEEDPPQPAITARATRAKHTRALRLRVLNGAWRAGSRTSR